MMISTLIPFAELAVVGVAGHMVERKLELSGHPGQVLLVKIATQVLCGLIAIHEWKEAIYQMGLVWGIHVAW